MPLRRVVALAACLALGAMAKVLFALKRADGADLCVGNAKFARVIQYGVNVQGAVMRLVG